MRQEGNGKKKDEEEVQQADRNRKRITANVPTKIHFVT